VGSYAYVGRICYGVNPLGNGVLGAEGCR